MASSVFEGVETKPPAYIFHLNKRYVDDVDARKLNLGIGVYRDSALRPFVFPSVRTAEAEVIAAGTDKEYLPIAGLPAFREQAARLLFGSDAASIADGRVVTVQSLSGTGALTLAALTIKRLLPGRRVFCSNPTWENHFNVTADAGMMALELYRYYDAATRGLDFSGMCADLEAVPEGSIILLHACAHNPTGVDPTREQWRALASLMKRRSLLPWFDCAYQGFASGDVDTDAWAMRHFEAEGFEMIVCCSFSKNMGLYCERVGALHIVTSRSAGGTRGFGAHAAALLTQIEALIRPMYSNPPAHGARIVARILASPKLNAEWRAELAGAMARIQEMRVLLRDALVNRGTPGTWGHITSQIGMFSYTGLTPPQCDRLVTEFHVYLLDSGRVNMAGLAVEKIAYAADCIDKVVRESDARGPS